MVCVVTDLCSLQFRFGFGTINGSAEIRAWPGPFCVVPLIVWLKWVGGITSDPSKPIHPTQIISTFSPFLFPFLCSSCCPGRARWHGAQSDQPDLVQGCQLWPLEIQQPLTLLPETRIWEQLGQRVGTAPASLRELWRLMSCSDSLGVKAQFALWTTSPFCFYFDAPCVVVLCYPTVTVSTGPDTKKQSWSWCRKKQRSVTGSGGFSPSWAWLGAQAQAWELLSPSAWEMLFQPHSCWTTSSGLMALGRWMSYCLLKKNYVL